MDVHVESRFRELNSIPSVHAYKGLRAFLTRSRARTKRKLRGLHMYDSCVPDLIRSIADRYVAFGAPGGVTNQGALF